MRSYTVIGDTVCCAPTYDFTPSVPRHLTDAEIANLEAVAREPARLASLAPATIRALRDGAYSTGSARAVRLGQKLDRYCGN